MGFARASSNLVAVAFVFLAVRNLMSRRFPQSSFGVGVLTAGSVVIIASCQKKLFLHCSKNAKVLPRGLEPRTFSLLG
jgi:hypothetical protein